MSAAQRFWVISAIGLVHAVVALGAGTDKPFFGYFVLSSNLAALCLIGMWMGLGTTPFLVRLAVGMLGATLLILLSGHETLSQPVVRYGAFQRFVEGFVGLLILATLPLLAITTGALIHSRSAKGTYLGETVEHGNLHEVRHCPDQPLTTRGLFLFTTAFAVIFGVIQWARPFPSWWSSVFQVMWQLGSRNFVLPIALGFVSGAVSLIPLWVMLRRQVLWIQVIGVLLLTTLFGLPIFAVDLLISLYILRGCGYRVVWSPREGSASGSTPTT